MSGASRVGGVEHVAGVVQRLAVLTGAGIPAASAWRHAAASSGVPAIADELESAQDLPARLAAVAGSAPPEERSAWSVVAAIWSVATETGAALAPTLHRTADVLRDLAQSAREVDTALAGPVATSRIVLALPLVGLLLGVILGFDVAAVFVTVPGIACLVSGGGLIALGVRWNRGLIRWARTQDATPGIALDLTATALSGGTSIDRAARSVAASGALAGLDLRSQEVDEVLGFASAAGVPAVALLRAEADEQRRRARADAASRAARLESRLLLPLGVCILPAFVLLGVVPTGIAILSSTALPV
ncbi:MAG TPA: type II secretion system F family protein [Pseudolysinimonas sp.]|nr:type II secretion system F family protein [Pseudolysinimonas sp.]